MTPEQWLEHAEAARLPVNSKRIARAAVHFVAECGGRLELTTSRNDLNRRLDLTNAQQSKAWRALIRDGWMTPIGSAGSQRFFALTIPTGQAAPEGKHYDRSIRQH